VRLRCSHGQQRDNFLSYYDCAAVIFEQTAAQSYYVNLFVIIFLVTTA